ncbi:MAG: glycerol 3-phosphate dehydrogenase, partial [Bacteroidetes bacterium]
MSETTPTVGVIGAGTFGTAIANLLAYNSEVLIYARKPEVVTAIQAGEARYGIQLPPRVQATTNLEEVAASCRLIFPVVPSIAFRTMMRQISPYLRPYHLLVHATKGFDLRGVDEAELSQGNVITRRNVSTMSEVIRQESCVLRIGCLSGPNLAREILEGQPTATVIASKYDEVITAAKAVLSSPQF